MIDYTEDKVKPKKRNSNLKAKESIGQTSLFGTHIVDNEKLYQALIIEKQNYLNAKATDSLPYTLSPYVAKCIGAICEGLAMRSNYRYYTYIDDMIASAIINCIKYWHNFSPEKYNNPHAYFTMIAAKSFNRHIKIEKKNQYIKYCETEKFAVEIGMEGGHAKVSSAMSMYLDEQAKIKDSFETKENDDERLPTKGRPRKTGTRRKD